MELQRLVHLALGGQETRTVRQPDRSSSLVAQGCKNREPPLMELQRLVYLAAGDQEPRSVAQRDRLFAHVAQGLKNCQALLIKLERLVQLAPGGQKARNVAQPDPSISASLKQASRLLEFRQGIIRTAEFHQQAGMRGQQIGMVLSIHRSVH